MMDLAPLRKLVIGAVASGIALALSAVGLDLGPALVNQAAVALVGFGAAYVAHDPRVGPYVSKAEHLAAELTAKGAAAEAAKPTIGALAEAAHADAPAGK